MIIEFSVKNFKTFKEKITLSMEQPEEIEDNSETISTEKISKIAAIYGANAAGKTNLVKAFFTAIMIVRNSNFKQTGEKITEIDPFRFDEESKFKPTEFEFIFINNKTKYRYGFSADNEKVYDEYLYTYNKEEEILIFKRNNVNEYTFLKEDEEILNNIKIKNTDNKLFLATATTWNYEKTKDACLWFNNIDTYNGGEFLNDFSVEMLSHNDDKLKKFTLNLLNQADIVIDDYNIEIIDDNPDEMSMTEKRTPVRLPKIIKIEMAHNIKDKDGNEKEYNMGILDESSGTKNIFAMAPILKDAFEKGKVIIVDELERSLHPILVEMIINLFSNPEINTGGAQLIFSTHNTNLLELNIIKREEIWFVEKNAEKGTTDIYSLVDFPKQEGENIQGKYLNGRYGAIPFVVTGNNKLWEEEK